LFGNDNVFVEDWTDGRLATVAFDGKRCTRALLATRFADTPDLSAVYPTSILRNKRRFSTCCAVHTAATSANGACLSTDSDFGLLYKPFVNAFKRAARIHCASTLRTTTTKPSEFRKYGASNKSVNVLARWTPE